MSNSKEIENQVNNLEYDKLRLKSLLAFQKEQINALSKLTDSVNKNFSSAAIIGFLDRNLHELMAVESYALLLRKTDWELMINKGDLLDLEQIEFNKDLHTILDAQSTRKLKNEQLRSFDYVLPVMHKNEHLAFLFLKNIKQREFDTTTSEKIKFIETLLSLTVISLENKRLVKKLKGDVTNEDLILAAEVQAELIPSLFPTSESFEFYGKYIPFDRIGGDYYDFIQLDDENIAFCICDVAGKGISAGMLMSNFQASLRTLLSRDYELPELVKALNTKFITVTKQSRYITMFIAKYNIKSRKLEYINAGHNPPILRNFAQLRTLTKGCTILGMIEDLDGMQKGEIILDEKAMLVMYTDGLSEIENNKEEEFGVKNISKYIEQHHNDSMSDFTEGLIHEVDLYRELNDFFDDISLLCARFF